MLYEIDGKIYVLASNKYREVTIDKDKTGGYDVKVVKTSTPIEKTSQVKERARFITVEQAHEQRRRSKDVE